MTEVKYDKLATNRFLVLLVIVTGVLLFGIEVYSDIYERYINIRPSLILLFTPIPIALALERILQSRQK
jgi:hypothetical protein